MTSIIKTSIAFALSIAALTAQAQHEVTIAIDNDDRATLSVLNTGPADVFHFSDIVAAPVPEPTSAALMLAGCLLIGAATRKAAGGAK